MRRRTLLAWSLTWPLLPGLARRPVLGGEWAVVIVMKRSDCPVCLAEIAALREIAEALGHPRMIGLTHDGVDDAAQAAAASGIEVVSDRGWIADLGLFEASWGHPRPAVVLFDPCGDEAGRVLGRGPSQLAATAVLDLRRRTPPPTCRDTPRS